MKKVTDPNILNQLNNPSVGLKKVTDPDILRQLNTEDMSVGTDNGRTVGYKPVPEMQPLNIAKETMKEASKPFRAAWESAKEGTGGIIRSVGESLSDRRSPAQQITDRAGITLPQNEPALKTSVTPEFIHKTGEWITGVGKDMASAAQVEIKKLAPSDDAPWHEKAGFGVLHNIGVNMPGLAASIITRKPIYSLASLGGISYGTKYTEERERGANVEEAHQRALNEAGSEIGTEFLPISILLKPGYSLAKRMAYNTLSEIAGENVNTAYSLLQDRANYAPDKPFGDFVVQDLFPAFKDTSTVSGISSLMMGGTVGLLLDSKSRRETPPFRPEVTPEPQIVKEPQTAQQPSDLFEEVRITGVPKSEIDVGKSERDIAKAKTIQDEMSHPDYNKYGDVKELYYGRVYDLRFANPDDIANINKDIAKNYKELGLNKDANTTNPNVMMRVLDKRVGDYAGVIGLDGKYYPSELLFGKEFIEEPKGVIERGQGQGQAETVAQPETRILPEEQPAIPASQPVVSPAVAATPPATTPAVIGGLKEPGSKPAKWLETTGTTKTILNKEERELLREAEATTPEILNEVRAELSKPNIVQEIKTKVASQIKIDQSLRDHFPAEEYNNLIKSAPNLFSNEKGISFDEVADGLGITTDELSIKLKDFKNKQDKLDSARQMVEDYKSSREVSPLVTVASLGLKVGTEFKIQGEKYKVISRDANGDFVIKDGIEYVVDEFDKIPQPDEGSIKQVTPKKGKIKQAQFGYDKTKVDVKPKMESSLTVPALQKGQKGFFEKVGITPVGEKKISKESSLAYRMSPEEIKTKIDKSLLDNKYDETIPHAQLVSYGKNKGITIPQSGKIGHSAAWKRLRTLLIDNPKGYDIVGKFPVFTDKEYLEGKSRSLEVYQPGYQSEEKSSTFKPEPGFRRKPESSTKKESPIKRSDIAKFLQEKLDIPIRKGRFNVRGALGIFKPKLEVVRTKFAHDIETISHELGHKFQQYLWGDLTEKPFIGYKDELLPIATKPVSGQPKLPEGFAEFIRLYITNHSMSMEKAPRFYGYFDTLLSSKSPEAHGILLEAGSRYENYLSQTPEQRKLSQISINDKGEKKSISMQDVVTKFLDELAPLKNIVNEISQGKDIPIINNPYKLARLMPGVFGKADAFLEYKPFDYRTFKFTDKGKSLKDILKQIPKNKLDLYRSYQISKSEYESYQNSLKPGGKPFIADLISIQDAKYIIEKYDKEFETVFKENVEYRDNLLKYFRDSGMIGGNTYNKFKELYKNYVPLYRMMETEKTTGSGKTLQPYQPIKERRGSWRDFIDPIESDIKNTYLFISLAEKNGVVNALVDLANSKQGMGKYVEKIPFPLQRIKIATDEILDQISDDPLFSEIIKEFEGELSDVVSIFRKSAFTPKENIISSWKNGKQNLYQVHPDIARTIQFLDKEEMNSVIKLLSYPARWLRAGAILNPEYLSRNPARDQFPAFIYSEYGYVPGVDLIRGIYAMARKSEDYWKFKISGAEHSMLVSLDRETLQKTYSNLLDDNGLYHDTFKNAIKNPIELLRTISEFGEMGTRLGEFMKGMKAEGQGKEGVLQSAFSAREVALDYGKKGSLGKIINSIVAFWNANVLDITQFYEKHKRDIKVFPDPPKGHKIPLPTTIKALAAITIPSIILAIINHDDEEIKQVPQWQKDVFWLINTGTIILRIPKPFLLGVIYGTVPERLVNYILDKDPHAFDGLIMSFAKGALPGFTPTALIPIIGNWANKSYFMDRPLVSKARERMLSQYQYQPYTTELAKKIGLLISKIPYGEESSLSSPAKLENLIQGWTGGMGKHILNIADYGLRKAGALEDKPKPSSTWADMPLVKAFVVRYPASNTESINAFYTNYSKFEKTLASEKGLIKEGSTGRLGEAVRQVGNIRAFVNKKAISDVHTALNNISETVQTVYILPNITPQEKRTIIDKLYLQMIDVAKEGNKLF